MKRWLVVRVSVAFTSGLLVGRGGLPHGATHFERFEAFSS